MQNQFNRHLLSEYLQSRYDLETDKRVITGLNQKNLKRFITELRQIAGFCSISHTQLATLDHNDWSQPASVLS